MVDKKKLRKSIRLLENDALGPKYTESPTKFLFISNSGITCNVNPTELLTKLEGFGTIKNFLSFREKSYTFVAYENEDQARSARASLNGRPLISQGHKICVFFVDSFPQFASRQTQMPKGLTLEEEFVTEEEESSLVKFLSTLDFEPLSSRLVKHFGYRFNYGNNTAFEETDPMPSEFDWVIERIKPFYDNGPPDQCTINFYKPGNGISPHVDNHTGFCETIVVISLSSSLNMSFHHMANSAYEMELFIPQRSLMIMKGEARYCYKHMIRSGSVDVNPVNGQVYQRCERYSLTFRKITHSPCQCPFPEYCNSDRGEYNSLPRTDEQAKTVEKLYVQNTYEGIAGDFDITRYSKWRSITDFLNTIPKGSVILDAGCGNGKYLSREPHHFIIGFDMCQNLLKAATKRGEVFRSSIFEIPMKDESVDAVISVAVVHHFPTPERRRQAIAELARVLVPGGHGCVTVWSFEQKNSIYAQMRSGRPKAIDPSRENGHLPIHDGTVFTSKDMLVPWLDRDHQQPNAFRYYHLFDEGELDSIVESVSGLRVISSQYEEGNYVVVFQKPPPKTTNDRAQLLSEIHRGTKLKKAVTNDRSAPQIGGSNSKPSTASSGGTSHSSVASTSTSSGQAPAAPAGLAGLFANGVPKKPSDAKKMAISNTLKPAVPTSSIPPPKPVNSMSLRNDGQTTTHFPSTPSHPVTTTTSSVPQAKQKPPPPEAPPAVNKPQTYNTLRPAVPNGPKPPQIKRAESTEENSNTSRNAARQRPAAPPPPPPSARPVMNTQGTDDLPPPPPPPRHASVEISQPPPPPPPPNFGAHKNNNNWTRPTTQPTNVPTYNSSSSSSQLGTSPILAGSHMRAVDAPAAPSTLRPVVKSTGKSFEERFRFLSVDQLPPPQAFSTKHAAV